MKYSQLIHISFIVGLLFFLASCESETPDYDLEEYPVVEAYLYPGEPINMINIFNMNNFSDTLETQNGISNLEITLAIDSVEYQLAEYSDNPGHYYYPDTNLVPVAGDYCTLEFEYQDKTVWAETFIPEKPESLTLSKSSLSVNMGGWGGSDIEPIEVTWDNPDNENFYTVATNIEEDPTPVQEDLEEDDLLATSFGTAPSTSNLINIVPNQCRYYGTYEFILFRVNQEFAELSLYTTTNTINLTEPYTNIQNGKGIFTAFATDTAYFEAVSSK